MRILLAFLVLAMAWPAAAGLPAPPKAFVKALDRMMVALLPQSLQASKAIRRAYGPQLDLLGLEAYAELEGALESGRVTPLPADPMRFNLAPRLEGPHPIGEKDLNRQHSYIAARPATVGLLIEIASRVKSGPLEITSLVRHGEYQESLASSNKNANTAVPMHTMGLAIDIALVNTKLETAYEIRDVLTKMRNAGDLMFIGERRQLVFHVVPHPARLAHFTDVYNRTVGVSSSVHGAHVIAASPKRAAGKGRTPKVTTEVIAILPTDEFANEWWIGDEPVHDHDAVEDTVPSAPLPAAPIESTAAVFSTRLLMVVAGLLTAVWRITTRRRAPLAGLLQR